MEVQSDQNMYQVTPAKVLGLACWDLRSRAMVLWKVGAREITDFQDNLHYLLQASYANTINSQETKWRHSGRSRRKTVMEFSYS